MTFSEDQICDALSDGPKSSSELGLDPMTALETLRAMERNGRIKLDPDQFPDEFVPGNPLVARLIGDERPWPGWNKWRI